MVLDDDVSLFIFGGIVSVNVDGIIYKHLLGPKLKGFYRNGDPFEFLLNMYKILNFIPCDLPVSRDFDKSLLLFMYGIQ